MNQAINKNSGINLMVTSVLLTLLFLLAIFHILILVRVIPFDLVWGGKLKDISQMILFETVSVVISLMMIAVVAINAGIIKFKILPAIIRGALLVMAFLFLLNTIGNFNSENQFERNVFTPMTLLLSLLCFILICTKRKSTKKEM